MLPTHGCAGAVAIHAAVQVLDHQEMLIQGSKASRLSLAMNAKKVGVRRQHPKNRWFVGLVGWLKYENRRNPIQESSIFVHGVHIFEVNFRSCHPKRWWKIWRILPRNRLDGTHGEGQLFWFTQIPCNAYWQWLPACCKRFFWGRAKDVPHFCAFPHVVLNLWTNSAGNAFFFDRRMKLDWSMIMMLFNNYWLYQLGSHRSFHVISSLPVPSIDLSVVSCRVPRWQRILSGNWWLGRYLKLRSGWRAWSPQEVRIRTVTITTLRTTFKTTMRTTAARATPPTTNITIVTNPAITSQDDKHQQWTNHTSPHHPEENIYKTSTTLWCLVRS